MGIDPEKPDQVRNWTYFFDFLDRFKSMHSERDWKHVLTEVRYAQRSGPSYDELEPIGDHVLRFHIDNFPGNGSGLVVVVDFEMDSGGIIEPVLGGSNQE